MAQNQQPTEQPLVNSNAVEGRKNDSTPGEIRTAVRANCRCRQAAYRGSLVTDTRSARSLQSFASRAKSQKKHQVFSACRLIRRRGQRPPNPFEISRINPQIVTGDRVIGNQAELFAKIGITAITFKETFYPCHGAPTARRNSNVAVPPKS